MFGGWLLPWFAVVHIGPAIKLLVQAGEVLDGIQPTNTAATMQGQSVPGVFEMPLHGGTSGNANTVTVPEGYTFQQVFERLERDLGADELPALRRVQAASDPIAMCADATIAYLIGLGARLRLVYTDAAGDRFETLVDNCPAAAGSAGHANVPFSRRLVQSHSPEPSQYSAFKRFRRLFVNRNKCPETGFSRR